MHRIQTVCIIGAGTQGTMLAFRSLAYGKDVFLYSRSQNSRDRALLKIRHWLSDWEQAGKLMHITPDEAMRRLTLFSDLESSVRDADLVIENVSEDLELKQRIWCQIDAAAPERTLLTTNSSSFTTTAIGKEVRRKDKTFNLNFMTPTQDDLVEVMWNVHTSTETKALALDFLKEQNQVPVVTKKEIKGFSLNRVWRAIKKEALKLWAEGYTTPEDFDRAWMLEWGTPYGPFGLMDRVGLDVVEQIEMSYYSESRKEDDLPPKALSELVKQGFLGEKSGKGFYYYPNPSYQNPFFLRGEEECKSSNNLGTLENF